MSRTKKIILGIIGLAILIYCSICGLLYLNQEKILFPGKKTPADYQYSFPIPFEEVWIEADNAKLHALYFPAQNSKGIIIFFHGNSERNDQFGASAAEFTSQGFDYLVPDYRGYGKSTGKIESEGQFLADSRRIFKWAKAKYPESQIVLAGRSLGAVPAAYLASKSLPRVTVLIAPFFNIDAMANIRYPLLPKFLINYKFRNDLWVKEIRRPVYFIHGSHDKTIPPIQSDWLADKAHAQHDRFVVRGAGHNNLQDFPRYHEILADLVNREYKALAPKERVKPQIKPVTLAKKPVTQQV